MSQLKILAVTEFDPAGVLGGHRAALRALGVDYRLAVMDVYATGRGTSHDWQATKDDGAISDFAERADIIQFHPGIGQPWSYASEAPHYKDAAGWFFGSVDWSSPRFSRARRISYFHGSRNAARNAVGYAKHWRDKGHVIWASTLDYVHWMEAVYAPPIVDLSSPIVRDGRLVTLVHYHAPRRGDDDPLVIAHAPTDPENCQTPAFTALCQRRGIVYDFIYNKSHPEVIERKARCNAGFDHLRGSFSVNTVENCMLGLVPLVGLKAEYRDVLTREIGPFGGLFDVEKLEGLEDYIVALDESPILTRIQQFNARDWAEKYWSAKTLGPKLVQKYEEALKL